MNDITYSDKQETFCIRKSFEKQCIYETFLREFYEKMYNHACICKDEYYPDKLLNFLKGYNAIITEQSFLNFYHEYGLITHFIHQQCHFWMVPLRRFTCMTKMFEEFTN